MAHNNQTKCNDIEQQLKLKSTMMMICRFVNKVIFVSCAVCWSINEQQDKVKNDGKTKLIGNLIPSGDAYTMFIIFTRTHPPTNANTTHHIAYKVHRIELNSHKEHDKMNESRI